MARKYDINPAAAILWASAFIIAALVIVQAGRLQPNAAYAGPAITGNGFTMVTSSSGTGSESQPDEVLFILDSHGDTLFVYEVEDLRKGITLRSGGPLSNLFNNARR